MGLLLSPVVFLYLPMIRYYTFASILVMFSTAMLFSFIHKNDRRSFVGLCVSYVLLLYTDYPSALIILSHAVIIVAGNRRVALRYAGVVGLAFILFIPWISVIFGQISKLAAAEQQAHLNRSAIGLIIKPFYTLYAFVIGEVVLPFEIAGVLGMIVLILLAIPWDDLAGNARSSDQLILSDEKIVWNYYAEQYERMGKRISLSDPREAVALADSLRHAGESFSAYLILTDRVSTASELDDMTIQRLEENARSADTTVYLRYHPFYKQALEKLTKTTHLAGKVLAIRYHF